VVDGWLKVIGFPENSYSTAFIFFSVNIDQKKSIRKKSKETYSLHKHYQSFVVLRYEKS